MNKRYLVTYNDRHIALSKASNILGISINELKEYFSFMAGKASINNNAIHFTNMGISSIELSSNEANALSQNVDIMAIEEDVQMHILGFPTERNEDLVENANEKFLWNTKLVKAPTAWASGITGSGVNLAILDTGIATHREHFPVSADRRRE